MEISFDRPAIFSSSSFVVDNKNQQSSMGFRGSNKHTVFDMSAIGNKLSSQQIIAPSSRAFQHQLMFKQKNYQSDYVKSAMQTPVVQQQQFMIVKNMAKEDPKKQAPVPLQLFSTQKSPLQIPSQNQQSSSIVSSTQKQLAGNYATKQDQKAPSQRSQMYDYRQATGISRSEEFRGQVESKRSIFTSSKQDAILKASNNFPKIKPLTPIKENNEAKISVLVPPSRSIMDPDNQILFLDNGSRILNPINAKTPPPPFWGEILEEEYYDPNEDFYDHEKAEAELRKRKNLEERVKSQTGKKIKKKVVYVYESDSDSDKQDNKQKIQEGFQGLPQSRASVEVKPAFSSQRQSSEQRFTSKNYQSGSAFRYDPVEPYGHNPGNQQSRRQESLPLITNKFYIEKPPLPSSQVNKLLSGNMPASRQIRTGGFQKLPIILANSKSK